MVSNEAVFRRFVEEIPNKGNFAALSELVAEDVVFHMPGAVVKGIEAFQAMVGANRSAWSDLQVTIEEVIPAGDRLVARVVIRGTNTGELPGLSPATGREATWGAAHIMRFEDGRIVEDRVFGHDLDLLGQLGLMPAPQPS